MKRFLFILIIVLAGFWFLKPKLSGNNTSSKFYVYNPYEQDLLVEYGDESYTVSAKEEKSIKVLFDSLQSIQSFLNNEKLIDTTILIEKTGNRKGGMINVSNQPMYLWKELYVSDDYVYTEDDEDDYTMVFIDSTVVFGDIKEYSSSQIFIPKEWDKSVMDLLDDEVMIYGYEQEKEVSKIFSKDDMVNYWETEYLPYMDLSDTEIIE